MTPEERLQVAVIREARQLVRQFPCLALLHHTPNGGLRDEKVAVKLRSMGALRGIPDLHLPVARSGYIGLWIELKTEKGSPSPEQLAVHELLKRENNYVCIHTTTIDTIRTITLYVTGGLRRGDS